LAEIKSAIELAMERTKSLVMDEQEKREFARRDVEERLKAIVRRFFEGIVGREAFLTEYRNVKAERLEKMKGIVDIAIEEFGASMEKERLFDLLEIVGSEVGKGLADEARALKDEFRAELADKASNVKKGILRRLSEMGIRGEGLEPNVEEWEEWKEAVRNAGSLFERRVREWKDKAENAPP